MLWKEGRAPFSPLPLLPLDRRLPFTAASSEEMGRAPVGALLNRLNALNSTHFGTVRLTRKQGSSPEIKLCFVAPRGWRASHRKGPKHSWQCYDDANHYNTKSVILQLILIILPLLLLPLLLIIMIIIMIIMITILLLIITIIIILTTKKNSKRHSGSSNNNSSKGTGSSNNNNNNKNNDISNDNSGTWDGDTGLPSRQWNMKVCFTLPPFWYDSLNASFPTFCPPKMQFQGSAPRKRYFKIHAPN